MRIKTSKEGCLSFKAYPKEVARKFFTLTRIACLQTHKDRIINKKELPDNEVNLKSWTKKLLGFTSPAVDSPVWVSFY